MTRYCGRNFSEQELEQIRKLIAEDAERTRAELSRLTCRILDWYKPDGGAQGHVMPCCHAAHGRRWPYHPAAATA